MGVLTSHLVCARMKEGILTNNFNYFLPNIKRRYKIDSETTPGHFSVINDINTETYFQASQTSRRKFAKLVNGSKQLTTSQKTPS